MRKIMQVLQWVSLLGATYFFIVGERVDTLNFLVLYLLFKQHLYDLEKR